MKQSTFFYLLRRGVFSGGASFETEYQTLLDKGTASGFSLPSSAQQTAQNNLLKSLKTDGILTKLDAFYLFATNGDSDFATLNWIDPDEFQATKVSSPTFTTNVGFNGNGTSSHVELGVDPTDSDVTKYTRNDASFGVYSWDDIETSANNYPITQSTRIRIFQRTASTNNRINNASPTSTEDISSAGTGLIGLNRASSTQYRGLSSDGNLGTLMNADSVVVNQTGNFVINKFSTTFKSGRIGLAWVGGQLTSTEWSNYVTAVNTYISTL